METTQLKSYLHLLIEQIEDNQLLEAIYIVLHKKEIDSGEFLLSDNQKSILENSLIDYKQNPKDGLSWDKVKERLSIMKKS